MSAATNPDQIDFQRPHLIPPSHPTSILRVLLWLHLSSSASLPHAPQCQRSSTSAASMSVRRGVPKGVGGGGYFQIDRITKYHRLAVCCLWDFFSITFILALLIFKLIKNVYQTGDIEDIEENVLYVPVDDAHAMAYAEWDN